LEAAYPDEDTPHAREGDAAHWCAALILELNNDEYDFQDTSNGIANNGEQITQEMWEGAKLYAEAVRGVTGYNPEYKLVIEERVNIYNIHPECWGTPDAWYYNYMENTLHIWDYKYGHKFVEVTENWQLIEYAAGIINRLGASFNDDTFKIIFYIVQPRSYHRDGPIRRWRISFKGLLLYFERLRTSESAAMEAGAQCRTNPDCSWCTASHVCEALQRAVLSAVDYTSTNVPFDLPPNAVGGELRKLRHARELMDARINGLSEQASSLLKSGKRVPYFKLESSPGREKWKKPAEEIAKLGELLNVPLRKPTEVITPKQAIKAGLTPELVHKYAETLNGALKLTETNDTLTLKLFGERNGN
jgi:hypothetical protein